MTTNVKSATSATSKSAQGFYRVAIVGAGSLRGKEVAEVLDQRNFPAVDVKLLDDDESLGQLEAMKDEITFIQSVRAEQFDKIDFTFFASDAECTRRNFKQVQAAGIRNGRGRNRGGGLGGGIHGGILLREWDCLAWCGDGLIYTNTVLV